MNTKAFTLIELIISITVVAIIGTIATIYFFDAFGTSRDSSRIISLGEIETGLDLFKVERGLYPTPDNPTPITFSGSEVWSQGTFGKQVNQNIGIFGGNFPIDPLYEIEYTYSTANNGNEYQLAGILEDIETTLESDIAGILVPQAHAAVSTAYVLGNYNGFLVNTSIGNNHYFIATPSIITSTLADTDVTNIISNQDLVFHNFFNLPHSYEDSVDTKGGFYFNLAEPLVFSGALSDLEKQDAILNFVNDLKYGYSNTPISGYQQYVELVENDGYAETKKLLDQTFGVPFTAHTCNDILSESSGGATGYYALDGEQEVEVSGIDYGDNIAPNATITHTPSHAVHGVPPHPESIVNGIIRTDGEYDYEYHSIPGNGFIEFNWSAPESIGAVRIYNRTNPCCDQRLTDAVLKFYDSADNLLYSHGLGDADNKQIIDVNLESLGEVYEVSSMRLETINGNAINIREIEIFPVEISGVSGGSVYCDMDTDDGGWTRIGDNHITNGEFFGSTGIPSNYYTYHNAAGDNAIVSIDNPGDSEYALHQTGAANSNYEIHFDDISEVNVGYEIRMSLWVRDEKDAWSNTLGFNPGAGYMFHNRLFYEDGTFSTNGLVEVLATQEIDGVTWEHQQVRHFVRKPVQDFNWYIGLDAEDTKDLYFTGVRLELFLK